MLDKPNNDYSIIIYIYIYNYCSITRVRPFKSVLQWPLPKAVDRSGFIDLLFDYSRISTESNLIRKRRWLPVQKRCNQTEEQRRRNIFISGISSLRISCESFLSVNIKLFQFKEAIRFKYLEIYSDKLDIFLGEKMNIQLWDKYIIYSVALSRY